MCSYKKQCGNITQHEKPIYELKPEHTTCLEIACHHTSACLLFTNSYSTKCLQFIYKYKHLVAYNALCKENLWTA